MLPYKYVVVDIKKNFPLSGSYRDFMTNLLYHVGILSHKYFVTSLCLHLYVRLFINILVLLFCW